MREQKITLGEMRQAGVHCLLIYCGDFRCSHHIAISAESWPDDVRLSDLEPRSVCKVCGVRGADFVRTSNPRGWALAHGNPRIFCRMKKFVEPSRLSDPEVAARKIVEIANGVEAVQDGRIYIERVNGPFLFEVKGTPAHYLAGIKHAIERG